MTINKVFFFKHVSECVCVCVLVGALYTNPTNFSHLRARANSVCMSYV